MDYDQTTMPAVYDAARGYSEATKELWRQTIVASAADRSISKILDLGCGTGRYTESLAHWFSADVVGVDPSSEMLSKARDKDTGGTSYILGSAEAIPLPEASIDLILMSMVFHHLNDKDRAIMECHRVLSKNGLICLRAGTTEQISNYPYTPFFNEAKTIFETRLQSRSEITAQFTHHGFELLEHKIIESEIAKDWKAFADKISLRADSTLNRLSDEDFQTGLKKLIAHAATTERKAVAEPIDYFVFQLAG